MFGLRDKEELDGAVQEVEAVVDTVRQVMPGVKDWVKKNSDLLTDAVSCLLGVVLDVGKGLDKEVAQFTALDAKWKMRTLKALRKEGFTRAEAMQIILAKTSQSVNWMKGLGDVKLNTKSSTKAE